jgi:DNA-binding GntR family transcriptional regulator
MAAPRTSSRPAPAPAAAPAEPPRLAEGALYERVAERVRERILAHSLSPGSWIDEQALTAELGISRTPLREALKVLEAVGLVTMKLRRGAYVSEVSEQVLTEVLHLLALLEIAGNRWRNQMVADLRKVMKLYRHHSLFKQGRLEASLKEHRRIMAALKARNAPLAQQLMQQHLAHGKEAASRPAT